MVDGQERDFLATEVRAIFRPERGAGRAAWIGLAVGAGIVVWPAAALGAFGVPAILGGIGAGIGAVAGSAFVHRKQIYETTPDPARPTGERVVPPRAPEVPSVQATAPNLARPRPDRKWAAAFLMGPTSSGPARDLAQAMRDAQFDESRFCVFVCSGSDPHPVSQTGFGAEGFPWHLSLQRRLSPWAALGVSAGHAAIGRTNGLKRDRFLDYLLISYGVTTVAPLFIGGPAEGFHAAAGPALFSTGFRDVGARWSAGLAPQPGVCHRVRHGCASAVTGVWGAAGAVPTRGQRRGRPLHDECFCLRGGLIASGGRGGHESLVRRFRGGGTLLRQAVGVSI